MIFELLHHLNVAFAVFAGNLIEGEMVVSFECLWSYQSQQHGDFDVVDFCVALCSRHEKVKSLFP